MCAGYDGDINFNPNYFVTREKALAAGKALKMKAKVNNYGLYKQSSCFLHKDFPKQN